MENKGDFAHEALIDTKSVAAYLRALADGFESRALRFSDRKGEMVLKPGGLVKFEVESQREGDYVRLGVKFDWKEPGETPEGRNGTLHIEARERS